MKMSLRSFLPSLALAALVLPGCAPSVGSLQDEFEAAFEPTAFGLFVNRGALAEEIGELICHYEQTEDAAATSPTHRLTMLHVAAMTHRLWLVEKLLAQGADPNARMLRPVNENRDFVEGDTPLTLALRHTRCVTRHPADARLVVEALLRAGAELNARVVAELYPRRDRATRAEREAAVLEIELAYSRIVWQHREELRYAEKYGTPCEGFADFKP